MILHVNAASGGQPVSVGSARIATIFASFPLLLANFAVSDFVRVRQNQTLNRIVRQENREAREETQLANWDIAPSVPERD